MRLLSAGLALIFLSLLQGNLGFPSHIASPAEILERAEIRQSLEKRLSDTSGSCKDYVWVTNLDYFISTLSHAISTPRMQNLTGGSVDSSTGPNCR
jgi:hypothetical protein